MVTENLTASPMSVEQDSDRERMMPTSQEYTNQSSLDNRYLAAAGAKLISDSRKSSVSSHSQYSQLTALAIPSQVPVTETSDKTQEMESTATLKPARSLGGTPQQDVSSTTGSRRKQLEVLPNDVGQPSPGPGGSSKEPEKGCRQLPLRRRDYNSQCRRNRKWRPSSHRSHKDRSSS